MIHCVFNHLHFFLWFPHQWSKVRRYYPAAWEDHRTRRWWWNISWLSKVRSCFLQSTVYFTSATVILVNSLYSSVQKKQGYKYNTVVFHTSIWKLLVVSIIIIRTFKMYSSVPDWNYEWSGFFGIFQSRGSAVKYLRTNEVLTVVQNSVWVLVD